MWRRYVPAGTWFNTCLNTGPSCVLCTNHVTFAKVENAPMRTVLVHAGGVWQISTQAHQAYCATWACCACVSRVSLTTRLPIIATPMGPSPNSTSGSSTGVTPTCMYTHTHITHGGSNGIALCDLEHALWHALCVLCVCYMCVCVYGPQTLSPSKTCSHCTRMSCVPWCGSGPQRQTVARVSLGVAHCPWMLSYPD